jgi:hypothetical protein
MDLASNAKVGFVTAFGTTSSGLGTALDYIPDDIGKLATLVGIIVSCVVGYAHWRMSEKARVETDMLRKQMSDRRKKQRSK